MYKSNVYLGQEKVGEASIRQDGLYYHFICRCRIPPKPIYCAMLRCGEKTFHLGVCVPDGNAFRAEKRIPAKLLPNSEFQFYIQEKNLRSHTVVVADSQKPFHYLEYLENAYLRSANGEAQICIPEIKDSGPSQPGSDQNPKYQNR